MPLILSPEPMPVEVIVDPALGVELPLDALLVGGMTELMAKVRALGC
jgi:hypothetical protein